MDNTWGERDFPVLDAIVKGLDVPGATHVDLGDIADQTGIDVELVGKASIALDSDQYFRLQRIGPAANWCVTETDVYGKARRAVGQWPSADAVIDALVRGLRDAADAETDPDQRSRLSQAAGVIGGAFKDTAVNIAASLLARQLGIQ